VNEVNVIAEIRSWEGKPKELVAYLTESIEKDERLFSQLIEVLKTGSDIEKGTCADVMKHVSKDKPEIFWSYVNEIIDYIDYRAPRVKWGIPETIGHLAQRFPKEVEKAIPRLLTNTRDHSTVVRWCAAFALCEIVKNNLAVRKQLVPTIEEIVKSEKNNGVRNVYFKALKTINAQ